MKDKKEEEIEMKIRNYWTRIGLLESRIEILADKKISTFREEQKRKNLIRNVKVLEKRLDKIKKNKDGTK